MVSHTDTFLHVAQVWSDTCWYFRPTKGDIHIQILITLSDPSRGGSRGAIGAIAPPKTYESNFIHHDFVQFEKQHSRWHAILPSIVLLQQYFEVYFVSFTVMNPSKYLTAKYYWNAPPLNLLAGSALGSFNRCNVVRLLLSKVESSFSRSKWTTQKV